MSAEGERYKQFSLHPLDNPNKPLTVKDRQGYIYYYNPCSTIVFLENPISQWQYAGAC